MLAASYGKKEFPYYTYDFHYEDFSYYIVYDFEKASTAINMQKKPNSCEALHMYLW